MSEKRMRIPLQESVSRKDVNIAAWDNKWLWQDKIPRSENNPYEVIWIKKDEQTIIHYIEDFLINVNYILGRGKDAQRIIEETRSKLATYSWNDIRQIFENAQEPRKKIQAIYYAGIAAPQEYDQEFFNLFEAALSDSNSDVRSATIVAIGYVGWLEFRELLKRIQSTDPDTRVRQDVGLMLEGLTKHNWQENTEG